MKSNKFDLSHEFKATLDGGKLVPILVQEVLPGDNFRIDPQVFMRCQPLIAPVMHRVDIYTYFFYVQNANIWNEANEFYTRGRDNDSTVTVPRLVITNTDKALLGKGELADYMGIPPIDAADTVNGTHYLNSLPFRAYQNIWNEIFRPQEHVEEFAFQQGGTDIATSAELTGLLQIRNRPWPKDYFTTSKVQAVLNPELNGYVAVQSILGQDEGSMYKYPTDIVDGTGAALTGTLSAQVTTGDLLTGGIPSSAWNLAYDANDYLEIGIDIDDIRRVSVLQRWVETLIRVGYRYPDYLKGIWGVKSKDSRLDRPEYLGGSSTPLRISEVLNTSDTANAVQGEMAGHGIASGKGRVIQRGFTEHGWIIGLMCVVPKANYFQGMDKFWSKFDHMDYATPMFANLGAQVTTSDELYYDWTDSQATNQCNFGYQTRYAEYKQRLDRCAGDLRDTLSYWTFARDFTVRPSLNEGFVTCTPKTSVFASTDDPYIANIYFKMSVLRKLPLFASLKID